MFLVEGNIGVGKSTFLRLLATYEPAVKIVHEPLQAWDNVNAAKSLLSKFYEDPHRWAYTFETNTLISRSKEYMQLQKNKEATMFIERSLFSGYYCFAYNSYESGFLTKLEWQLYRTLFHEFVAESCKLPLGFIYLRVHPEIAFERIKKRDRACERSITLDYIKQIHERHEAFLVDKSDIIDSLKRVPCLVIDCDQEFEADQAHYAQHFHAIKKFVERAC